MDDTETLLIVVGAIIISVVFLILGFSGDEKKKITLRDNFIQDDKVTVSLVFEKIKLFKPEIIDGRKNGFTEKDIHKQMEKYFKDIFQNVTMEHGIESKNAKAIDIDIANGKAGIEVKVAHELLKEGEWDRAIGQMVKYTRKKYNKENFIVVVVGFEKDFRNSMLSDVEDDVHSNNGLFWFANADEK